MNDFIISWFVIGLISAGISVRSDFKDGLVDIETTFVMLADIILGYIGLIGTLLMEGEKYKIFSKIIYSKDKHS